MEPISFGLAIITEARTAVTSIQNRIASYRHGPATFRKLTGNLDCLAEQIAQVEMVLEKFPTVVPNDISVIFDNTFSRVHGILEDSNATIGQSFSKAFGFGSRSVKDKLRSKAIRTFRANALRSKMEDVEAKIKDASGQLLQLSLSLGNSLKMQEQFETLALGEAVSETFCPRTNAPALNETVEFEFDAKDPEGKSTSPEGILKHSVLFSDSSSTVTAATGVMKPAYGIVGMAGVGKTVALQGLAYDKDVRLRFPDGILFLTLGQGATVQTVLRELSKFLAITGANKLAAVVEKCSVLRDAVDYATPWFENRICLFLVDDIWPTIDCKTGFLADLRQLLRDSPDSRMAISTRSTTIAQAAGAVVKFGARDPLGIASMNIFMAHATSSGSRRRNVELSSEPGSSILKILSICAGLPIALAVTGSAVGLLTLTHGDFKSACKSYATRLEKKRSLLGVQDTLEGTSLNAGIFLSLEYLEIEFLKWTQKRAHVMDYSISDLYTSLCVLENQSWASVSVLGRLWRLDKDAVMDIVNLFCGMSLATLQLRLTSSGSSEEAGIVLHDLQLDFCQREAVEKKESSDWHAQLLNGYLETSHHALEEPDAQLFTRYIPRPWWSDAVPEDQYIHENLSRHLLCSGNIMELAALLLDWRWTELRGRIGGILPLKGDFEILDDFLLHWESLRGQKPHAVDVRRGFDQIFKAVQLSWGRMTKGLKVFQFHLCGRLVSLRKSNVIVDAFVRSVDKYAQKPFLLPVTSFFPALDDALIMEIPVGGAFGCVACSPCGRYIAAGAGCDIVVAKSASGEIVQVLCGHTDDVRCIEFVARSEKIVSGSADRTVMVWEWESSESPVHVLKGHVNSVSGLAVSGDGGQIFSGSGDKTLRFWDAVTGTHECVLPQSNGVKCVAICGESQNIAIGLDGGTLKVLDSITKKVLFEDTEAHKADISCVSFSPNGSCLATGSRDKAICLWSTKTWRRLRARLKGHKKCVTCVCFCPDGIELASCADDGTIRLWDVATGNCVGISPREGTRMNSVSFIGDGKRIVSGSSDGVVCIWDARLGAKSKKQFYGHSGRVYGVAISRNGLQVASASSDGTVRLWDAQAGEQVGAPMQGQNSIATCVSFSPDGRRVVSGSTDCALRLWNTGTQTQIGGPFEGHTQTVHCVSFSWDGFRIISGSRDGTVRIWSAVTREQIGNAIQGHQHWSVCVSESADAFYIVSRDNGGLTNIWNRKSGAMLWQSKRTEPESEHDSTGDNKITDDEAEQVIFSCGQLTPHLWPNTFPEYTAELYSDGYFAYSNVSGQKTILAEIDDLDWRYHVETNVFAAGLRSGAVAICKLSSK